MRARARAYALIGEKDKAFDNLNKAVDHGYSSKEEFENEKDLATLKSDVRWNALMEKMK